MKLKSFLSAFYASIIVVAAVFQGFLVSAATPATFALSAEKYNAASQNYGTCTAVYANDLIRVAISSNKMQNIGGIRLSLSYNSDVLKALPESSKCDISDPSAEYDFYDNASKSICSAVWYTTNDNVAAENVLFYIYFRVNSFVKNTQLNFSLNVAELFDVQDKDIPLSNNNLAISVTAISAGMSDEDIIVFEKLITIEYSPECLQNISDADVIFKKLTSAQLLVFKTQHPELYNAYISAKNRYNDLAYNASQKEVENEINTFKNKYNTLLTMNIDDVDSSLSEAITELSLEYKNLSSIAKSKLDQATKDKITSLKNKISEIESEAQSVESAKNFSLQYANVLNIDYQSLKLEGAYQTMASEAITMYEVMLSDDVKKLLTSEKEKLDTLKQWIEEIKESSKEEKIILEDISAFQKKWIYVLTLSSATVELGDKSAIKLMLDDLKTQSSEVQTRLSSKKVMAEAMLKFISDMESQAKSDGVSITDIVQNTKTPAQTQTQTVPVTKTVTKVQTVTETVTKTATSYIGNMPMIIIILSMILGISILLMLIPVGLYIYLTLKFKPKEELFNA